jgi:hypothetical protein
MWTMLKISHSAIAMPTTTRTRPTRSSMVR